MLNILRKYYIKKHSQKLKSYSKIFLGTAQFGMRYGVANEKGKIKYNPYELSKTCGEYNLKNNLIKAYSQEK